MPDGGNPQMGMKPPTLSMDQDFPSLGSNDQFPTLGGRANMFLGGQFPTLGQGRCVSIWEMVGGGVFACFAPQ